MMKTLLSTIAFILFFAGLTQAQTATPPALGTGTQSDPYQIANLDNLYWLSQADTAWGRYYIQTADIEADSTQYWASGKGFSPIGDSTNQFTGNYNGQGYSIDSLTINRSTSYVGLFGYTSNDSITNVGLTHVNVTGGKYVGGLVGMNTGTIQSSYATGSITGDTITGGLVGENDGKVLKSYATGIVTGSSRSHVVGGLIGKNGSVVSNSYSRATVSGTDTVGGLAGNNTGTIGSSYSAGSVTGIGKLGGLVGTGSGTVSNSFWGEYATSYSAGGTPETRRAMKTESTYTDSTWDFQGETVNGTADIWGINSQYNGGYPFLSWQENNPTAIKPSGSGTQSDPYKIANLFNLYWLSMADTAWDRYYVQTAYIDAAATKYWNSGNGFSPIGNDTTEFTGIYDGQGFKIDGLFINRTSDYQSLFGYISSTSTVKNIGVTHTRITGSDCVSALVGRNNGTVSGSYSTGSISGINVVGGLVGKNGSGSVTNSYSKATVSGTDTIGGLAGYNTGIVSGSYTTGKVSGSNVVGGLVGKNGSGSLTNCYSTSTVSGTDTIGGLAGDNNTGTITDTYSTGKVSGSSNLGGLVGTGSGTVSNSFWNTGTSGQSVSAGGTSETTAIMQTESTYTDAGWDFQGETANGTADIWGINSIDNGKYPFLAWQGYATAVKPSGSGTQGDPYQIANLNNLYWLSQADTAWDKYYVQTADIDAANTQNWNSGQGFSPIGNDNTQFTGSYDGQGHTIDSLKSNRITVDNNGLFGYTSKSVIKNIGLTHVDITGWQYVGGLVGYSWDDTIQNSFVSGSITGGNTTQANIMVIASSISYGEVGGLAGEKDGGMLQNCYTTGEVRDNGYYKYPGSDGGLVGMSTGMVQKCYSSDTVCGIGGTITGLGTTTQTAGGLVGTNSDTIQDSYATGQTLETTNNGGGGLVGTNTGTIQRSYSKGSVGEYLGYGSVFGGLVGANNGKVQNCYSMDTILPINDGYNGELVGINNDTIENSYSVGIALTTQGLPFPGVGFVGSNNGIIKYGFMDTEASHQSTSTGTGKTTAEMKTESTYTNAGWDFDTIWAMNGSLNSGYPYLLWQHPNSWTGAVSSDWNTIGNWYSDTVPTTQDVYINRSAVNFPVVDSGTNALSNKIVVDSTATLTVATGSGLIVSDSLINNGTFTIESDESANGSLIVKGGVGGSGTYIRQQYISDNDRWHMIASPSHKDTIVGSDFVPSAPLPGDFDFYSFDQSVTPSWVNIRATSDSTTVNSSFGTDFIPGKGYLAAYTPKYGKTTVDFKGPFNTGDVTPPALAYTSGATHAGWNLIGNPYTSAIDWNKAVRTDFSDNYAYVYDPNKFGGPGYDDVNGGTSGAYIAPGQAFFVHVNSSPSTAFKFTSSMQVNEPTVTLKSTEATQGSNELVLRLSSKSHYDQTTIQVIGGTKSTRDRDDALELLSLDDSIPQIYSNTSDSVAVAINSYPSIDSIFTVQLGTYIPFQGTYTISLQQHDGVFSGQSIDLEDLSKGTVTDLTKGSYTFTGNKSDVRRFVLTINGTTGIKENSVSSGIQVYGYHSSIYIQTRDGSNLNGKVTVYNLMGEVVYRSTLNDTPSQVLNLQVGNGMYVVELNLKSGKRIVNKVVIEQ